VRIVQMTAIAEAASAASHAAAAVAAGPAACGRVYREVTHDRDYPVLVPSVRIPDSSHLRLRASYAAAAAARSNPVATRMPDCLHSRRAASDSTMMPACPLMPAISTMHSDPAPACLASSACRFVRAVYSVDTAGVGH
jgi:hypothetical protein